MRVLNLYAGIGGNRKDWPGFCQVTAVEHDPKIAKVYSELYPQDRVIVGDAHAYLLEHAHEFDFIWTSPPCQSHSRMILSGRNRPPRYPDMSLYQEILFLQHKFKGYWVVENVKPFYEPLVEATQIGRHLFWSNFDIDVSEYPASPANFINQTNLAARARMMDWLGIHFDTVLYVGGNHCPCQVLRNAVHPKLGRSVFDCQSKNKTSDMFMTTPTEAQK